MRIVCPQSTLDISGEAYSGPVALPPGAALQPAQGVAHPATNQGAAHPLTARRAAPPIPHDRQPQTTRARPHPYAVNTRARAAAATAAQPNGTNKKGDAINNNTNNNVTPAPPAPKRVPRMTNSARHVLHYNALHRESSTRRLRPRNRDAKLEKVDAARRKENLKKECGLKGSGKEEKRRRRGVSATVREYKYVYVGNLPTSITEARIQEFFTQNGVRDLDGLPSIRTTGGTVGAVVIPSELRTERDRRYACVRFKSHDSVYRALKLHKTMFEGMELVVTIDPTNLPECHQILSSHMEEIKEMKAMQTGLGRQIRGRPSPLQLQDTERTISSLLQQNATGRFKVFGVSFAPCIS
ncbi:hypothetical protein BJ165DRAFT_110093 [Panaeolus papilionaceus]|nr:hypothetical protein BJ165DRAFT_110093 [Panaeolus papilionaceus]